MSKLCNKSTNRHARVERSVNCVSYLKRCTKTNKKKRKNDMSKSNSSSSVAVIKRQLALLCYDTEDPLNALQNRDKKYYYYSWTRTYSNTCMWVFVSQLFECAKLLMNSRRRFFFSYFFLRYIPKISLCPGTPKPVTNLSIIIMRRKIIDISICILIIYLNLLTTLAGLELE